jgi:hypothetical protein
LVDAAVRCPPSGSAGQKSKTVNIGAQVVVPCYEGMVTFMNDLSAWGESIIAEVDPTALVDLTKR